ncbi:cupin domain-containing protein [soil metagenome]
MKHGYHAPIEELIEENTDFRRVLYTGEHCQLVAMSLAPGEEIGLETHAENDQFFRFEAGEGRVVINETEYVVKDGDAVIVPAGALHNVVNTSESDDLKLYTLYAPAHHQDGIVRATKAEAEANSPDFDGKVTESE